MWYQTSEDAYKKYKASGVFDMDLWLATLAKVDLDLFDVEDKVRIKEEFTHPLPDKATLTAAFQEDSGKLLRSLINYFMRDAYDNKGIPFIISGTIWDLMMQFWFRENHKKVSLSLTSASFDKHCGGLVGFFSHYFCNAVGTTYGAYYVYDFLHRIGLIDDTLYKNALIGIKDSNESIKKTGARVWRNGFPKYWPKPDALTDAEHTANIKAMDDAFEHIEVIEHKKVDLSNLWGEAINNLATPKLPLPAPKAIPISRPKPIASTPKVGRNEPCPCGSGKKYKHCCGK